VVLAGVVFVIGGDVSYESDGASVVFALGVAVFTLGGIADMVSAAGPCAPVLLAFLVHLPLSAGDMDARNRHVRGGVL